VQDLPDFEELLAAVRRFIEEEAVPAMPDQRLRFRARIAANLLGILGREAALGRGLLEGERRRLESLLGVEICSTPLGSPEDLPRRVEELNRELARRIRTGEIDASPGGALWEHLRLTAVEKLRIANPGFLDRLGGSKGP